MPNQNPAGGWGLAIKDTRESCGGLMDWGLSPRGEWESLLSQVGGPHGGWELELPQASCPISQDPVAPTQQKVDRCEVGRSCKPVASALHTEGECKPSGSHSERALPFPPSSWGQTQGWVHPIPIYLLHCPLYQGLVLDHPAVLTYMTWVWGVFWEWENIWTWSRQDWTHLHSIALNGKQTHSFLSHWNQWDLKQWYNKLICHTKCTVSWAYLSVSWWTLCSVKERWVFLNTWNHMALGN